MMYQSDTMSVPFGVGMIAAGSVGAAEKIFFERSEMSGKAVLVAMGVGMAAVVFVSYLRDKTPWFYVNINWGEIPGFRLW